MDTAFTSEGVIRLNTLEETDFGDDWKHTLELEESLTPEMGMDYRAFLDGERRCPPEDCGGAPGYTSRNCLFGKIPMNEIERAIRLPGLQYPEGNTAENY